MKNAVKALGASSLVLASYSASAVTVVGTEVATQITDTTTDITTAGGYIIGLAVLAMGIRWVKATFF